MIQFFRKIRQKLVLGNKFSKYLLYAIGEIILVVIGILIALQLNNIQEEKKKREKERSYLKEINLDFKSNKEQLDSIIAYNKVSLHAGRRLQEILKKFEADNPKVTAGNRKFADSIGYYNNLVWRNKSFNPKNGTVEALLNSSSFDLITNDTLRRNLIAWRDVLGDYLEEEQFGIQFLFSEYDPWIRANLDPENATVLFSIRNRNYLFKRIGDLNNNLTTVKEEGVVDMINEIIRLTEKTAHD
ncbi:MAG: DUF6090 family protein [Bacteroidota bacterium]